MPYTFTSETQNAVPGKPLATPKTHTPGSRVKNLGYRYFQPETGRWLSRDPIGEVGGRNLYSLGGNRPVDRVDAFGLWPWSGCCNGVKFNTFKQCCCDHGVPVKNGNGCDLIDDKKVDTGIKQCAARGRGLPGILWHAWLELDGNPVGFWPDPPGHMSTSPGKIHDPDEGPKLHPNYSCSMVKLSPCKYDISKFRACLKTVIAADKLAPPDYRVLFNDCDDWQTGAVNKCLKAAEGQCARYP